MKRLLTSVAALLAIGIPFAAGSATAAPEGTTAGTMSARPSLTVRSSRFGPVLFDGNGRVLYGFTRDPRGGKSRCYGDCASAWPVYYAPKSLKAGKGVKQSLIKTVRRSGGRLQVTYNGWPLYYYVDDGVGEIKCQNVDEFGGLWLVVHPSGKLVR